MSTTSRRFFNRELSWLEFNQRVLECAAHEHTPALERLKFLAITASNLDEFFMVRVGGLSLLAKRGIRKKDPAGMTPLQQLTAIYRRVGHMVAQQDTVFSRGILPRLAEHDLQYVPPHRLNEVQHEHCVRFFEHDIQPLLTPIGIGTRPLPLLKSGDLYFLIRCREGQGRYLYYLLRIEPGIPRIVALPAESGYRFIFAEDIITLCADTLFPNEHVYEKALFRITRNADLALQEDLAGDLLEKMENVLDARKRSDCIRLEAVHGIRRTSLRFLQSKLGITARECFFPRHVLDFTALFALYGIAGFDRLRYPLQPPQYPVFLQKSKKIFDVLRSRDIALYHPYESFDPVVRLVTEAADDPDVLAIKQTLYRTSGDSPIIAALRRAAQNGKSVTTLVELKARFDEARNIEWAKELEDAGVQVVYGIRGLKTHAKVLLVIRRESGGLQRYVHFGTGNYNEKTARLYTDVSLLTYQYTYKKDAAALFNIITGYSRPRRFKKLAAAPLDLRSTLLELIEQEIAHKKEGTGASIMIKVNALLDPALIEALYKASRAGVAVHCNVRSSCTLRPGVKGLSEHITVKSIVGRYLEHCRIYFFHAGGERRVFLSSADMMPRNLDRRIEHMTEVDDPDCKEKCISILRIHLQDTADAWQLQPDGSYRKDDNTKEPFSSQQYLYAQTRQAVENETLSRPIVFEPYWSADHMQ
jgi:polyphosphate kinase